MPFDREILEKPIEYVVWTNEIVADKSKLRMSKGASYFDIEM